MPGSKPIYSEPQHGSVCSTLESSPDRGTFGIGPRHVTCAHEDGDLKETEISAMNDVGCGSSPLLSLCYRHQIPGNWRWNGASQKRKALPMNSVGDWVTQ